MQNKKIHQLKQKLAQSPNNIDVLLDIAIEYERMGNYYRAGKYLKKVLEVNPNNIAAVKQIRMNEMRFLIQKYGSFKSFHQWCEVLSRGRAGDPMVLVQLIKGLHDRHKWVRKECIYALGEIGNDPAIEALVAVADQPDVKDYVEQVLGEICNKKPPSYLLQKAKEVNKQVCINIIIYLGFKKDPNAADALINIVRNSEEDKWIRGSASWALGMIGDSKALATLKNVIQNEREDYVREESEEAYHKIQNRLRALQHPENN